MDCVVIDSDSLEVLHRDGYIYLPTQEKGQVIRVELAQ